MQQTLLTKKEAYLAMLDYLEGLRIRTNSDDLAEFLGDMLFTYDGYTADPASWHDWSISIAKIKTGKASIEFIEFLQTNPSDQQQ